VSKLFAFDFTFSFLADITCYNGEKFQIKNPFPTLLCICFELGSQDLEVPAIASREAEDGK
jgi:hypothetical protein